MDFSTKNDTADLITDFTFNATDNTKLAGRVWHTSETPNTAIVLVHGVGEHMLRYEHVARALTDKGFAVIAFDQRGHGRSEGKRGHAPSAKQLNEDINQVLQKARNQFGEIPLFLYGHSLGALEVLYYCLIEKPDLKGVIATSPPLDISSTPRSKVVLAKVLDSILPDLTLASGLDAKALSRDPEVVSAYIADPLVHDKISVRLGNFLLTGAEYVLAHAAEWTLPLYLAHGTADQVCLVNGSDLFKQRANGHVTYRRWEGLYHETHNEPEKEQVLQAMISWISSRN